MKSSTIDRKPNSRSGFGSFLKPNDHAISPNVNLRLDDHKGITGENIITLSTQDWTDLWTRKQRFVLQFARQGNRVLYVETQFHWLSYIKQFRKHWRRLFLFLLGPREVAPNLFVYTPPLLIPAFQIFGFLAVVNNALLALVLRQAMKALDMRRPVLWMYTHFNSPLVKALGAKRALYECVDDYAGAKGLIRAETVRRQERQTLKSVAAAIVTADSLKLDREEYNRNIYVVSNAANVSHFNQVVLNQCDEPQELRHIPRPRLVFLGLVAYWIDLDLISYTAQEHPEWHIVFIGPVGVNLSTVSQYANVHFLGRRAYEDLPAFLSYCDIALNPYKVDDVAKGCSPLKLYEYLAAGLPVVSTEMPEARKFPNLVSVATDYRQFVSEIDRILRQDESTKRKCRDLAVAESKNHSWEQRFLQVEKIAQEVLP